APPRAESDGSAVERQAEDCASRSRRGILLRVTAQLDHRPQPFERRRVVAPFAVATVGLKEAIEQPVVDVGGHDLAVRTWSPDSCPSAASAQVWLFVRGDAVECRREAR